MREPSEIVVAAFGPAEVQEFTYEEKDTDYMSTATAVAHKLAILKSFVTHDDLAADNTVGVSLGLQKCGRFCLLACLLPLLVLAWPPSADV